MPNYLPKGKERMRELARRGGLASGETRKLKWFRRIIWEYARRKLGIDPPATPDDGYSAAVHEVWEFTGRCSTLEEIAEAMRPVDCRGGSHDSEWRCPDCHHFNSIKRWACAKCNSPAPQNGRLTRKALRERIEEHRVQAILRKTRALNR